MKIECLLRSLNLRIMHLIGFLLSDLKVYHQKVYRKSMLTSLYVTKPTIFLLTDIKLFKIVKNKIECCTNISIPKNE